MLPDEPPLFVRTVQKHIPDKVKLRTKKAAKCF